MTTPFSFHLRRGRRLVSALVVLLLLGCAGGGDREDSPRGTGENEPQARGQERVESASAEAAEEASEHPRRRAKLKLGSDRDIARLEAEELEQIKRSTVLLRTSAATGTGFGFMYSPELGYLVLTNAHVAGWTGSKMEVVFDSGSPASTQLTGRVLAVNEELDLSVVQVPGVAEERPVLSLASRDEFLETQPVLVAGFPFGELLAAGDEPEPTITTGTISSLRRNAQGHLEQVQLDGDLNPGNSGGPVFDTEGRVIGVAVATVLTTNISFMIPASTVHRFFAGTVREVGFVVDRPREGPPAVVVSFFLGDPFSRIQEVGVFHLKGPPRPDGGRMALNAMVEVPVEGDRMDVRVALGDPLPEKVWLIPFFTREGERQSLESLEVPVSQPAKPVAVAGASRVSPAPASPAPTKPPAAPPEEDPRLDERWVIPRDEAAFPPSRSLSGVHLEITPERTSEKLLETPIELPEGKLSKIEIDFKPFVHTVLPSGRDHVLVLETTGLLRRIALADLSVERKLEIDAPVEGMALSSAGLLVYLASLQELLLVDPETLKPKGAISVPPITELVAVPASSLAFALEGSYGHAKIVVVDVAARRVVLRVDIGEYRKSFEGPSQTGYYRKYPRASGFSCRNLAMPPDGRTLFCVDRILFRISLKDRRLLLEESSVGFQMRDLAFSPDSRRVMVSAHRLSGTLGSHPEVYNGAYVYDIEDLHSPLLVFRTDLTGAVFTRDEELPYLAAGSNRLSFFNARGLEKRSLEIPSHLNVYVRGIYPLPGGHGYWLSEHDSLYWFRGW